MTLVLATYLLVFCGEAFGGQPPTIADQQIQRQQEQERQRLQEAEDARPDVRLQPEAPPSSKLEYPEDEKPCFLIKEIRLEGDRSEKFQWALKPVKDAIGRCLGGKGVNIVMSRVQNAILQRGFTTTRVVAAPQNLKSGILILKVIPGLVTDVYLSKDSGVYQYLYPMMPVRKAKILNIRNVEQGLENLRRIPTVVTDIKLVPGDKEGESKMEVVRKQGRPVRVTLSADDSGSRFTGKNQGTATLHLDNMLGLSDMFYASVSTNLEHRHKPFGSNNYSLYYSVPWTFWQLTFYHSDYDYHQKVVGYATDYKYSGESQNTNLELSRVLFRTSKSKTSASVAGWMSQSRNYIDDTELEIQRRRMAGWEIGVSHRQFIGPSILDVDVKYKRGTGLFKAIRAPEERVDNGTSRPQILTLNARFNLPFRIKNQQFRFSTSWRQQWAFTKLLQRDRLSIGSRYTVRGYDGEYTLSGDSGFVSRTELGYTIPKIRQEVYAGFDIGRAWGPHSENLLGQTLSGAVLGLRGGYKRFSYDCYVSRPVNKPYRYPGNRWVGGFSANIQF